MQAWLGRWSALYVTLCVLGFEALMDSDRGSFVIEAPGAPLENTHILELK